MSFHAGMWLQKLRTELSGALFLKYLLWQTRPALIKAHLAKKLYPSPLDNNPHSENKQNPGVTAHTPGLTDESEPFPNGQNCGKVRVAAIQSRLTLVENVLEYVDTMYLHTAEAVAKGADLLVFPEDNATQLLGLLPGISNLPREANLNKALASLGDTQLSAGDVFSYLTPVTRQVYFTTFKELARRFGVYIMGGSIIIRQDGAISNSQGTLQKQVVNAAYLFAPSGEPVGQQVKAHLLPVEAEWGISCGCDLQVYSTPLGNLAFPVCMDATYFETFRILANRGAEIILVPTANPDRYNFWKALRGAWPRVQETPVYGVTSALVGEVLGMELTGRAGVFAPLELTPNGDGVLAQAPDPHQEAVVVADLDLKALRQYRKESQIWERLNRKLVAKYLPEYY
ncbi:MAG: nitrilase [Clostridia bacterium]|nr:nitrilase [Clostridia bacterium]